jgi:carbon-monoxide dehydrogenase medium subunit
MSFEQAASGYPLVGVAVVAALSRKTVTECAVAITGVSDHPFLVASAASLVGTTADAAARAALVDGALSGVTVNSDLHAPADYRSHLARVAVQRALAAALGPAR